MSKWWNIFISITVFTQVSYIADYYVRENGSNRFCIENHISNHNEIVLRQWFLKRALLFIYILSTCGHYHGNFPDCTSFPNLNCRKYQKKHQVNYGFENLIGFHGKILNPEGKVQRRTFTNWNKKIKSEKFGYHVEQ